MVAGCAFCLGFLGRGSVAESDDAYAALSIFARVLGYIEENYIEAVPVERLVRAAIRGLVSELDGPSAYLDREAYEALQAESRPDFGGIGVVLRAGREDVRVVNVHPRSPAARAGLRPGDRLVSVDGRAVAGQPSSRVFEWLTGAPGTRVTLVAVPREGGRPHSRTLIRATVFRPSVTSRRIGEVAYLRLLSFDERTSADLLTALDAVGGDAPTASLVLDLRGNPGGLLEQAVLVADVWLRAGVVVQTEGRTGGRDRAEARPDGTEDDYPMAVLIDRDTASAAEIVAGALQDHGRARVFGEDSFGKGSVQTVIELSDGSALKLTVARYLTPTGRSIQGRGISPDEVVHEDETRFRLGSPGRDQTLAAALRWLRGRLGEGRPSGGSP